jgi:uncharacterized coiled-coil DUF342 family protein
MQHLRDAGYMYAGFTSRDRNTGEFNYGYGVVLRGANGSAKYYKGAVPAQAASAISALEKKIKAMNQRHKEINERQKAIPKEKEDTKKECGRLAEELRKAKEARKKAADNLAENNAIQTELDNLYNQIAQLLKPLSDWCDANGNTSLGQQIKALIASLANSPDYNQFLQKLNNLIQQKKAIENKHKQNIERIKTETEKLQNENGNTEDGINNDKNKGQGYGGDLGGTLDDIDNAIAKEQAARAAAEAEKIATRKRECLEFLKFVAGSDGDAGMMAIMDAIKSQIQSIGQDISDGLGAAASQSKEKTKERIEKVKEKLDGLLGALEKLDELKEKVDELLDIKEKLETLLSGDDSPEAMAKKFGAYMGLISKVLGEISEKFPILQFFTAYFSYLVDGYNAAIDGAYGAFRKQYKYIIEQKMADVSCTRLVEEYQKNKSLEDVYRLAYKLCEGEIYADHRSSENRRIFQEQVNKAALKKMIDCCIKWSS